MRFPFWKSSAEKQRGIKANYDAAKARRRLAGWNPSTASARKIIEADGAKMRARARDLVRNNPYAASARDSFVANLIGAGIKPSSKIGEPDVRAAIHQTWLDWTDEADADGMYDFYGLQGQIASALFEAGECFVRFRARRTEDVDTVPLQLQLLESDMLDMSHTEISASGNPIFNGVEFDLIGRRMAYHFWVAHPGEATVDDLMRGNARGKVRVPASEVLHIANMTRPGQVRGVPIVAPAIVKLWLLDQYDDAELDRKKTAAMYAGFITSPEADDVIEDDDEAADDGIVTLEPATMQVLKPGEEITFSTPAEVGGSYEAFQYRNLLSAFAAMGVPYAFGTGDLKRANYSSLRGAIVEYRRRLEQYQFKVIVFQFCRPVWARWLADGVVSGALNVPGFAADRVRLSRVKWIPPRFEWVDPLKDIKAEREAVDAGFKSRSDVVEGMGEDPEDNDARIRADKDREARLQLRFNSDAAPVSADTLLNPSQDGNGDTPADGQDAADQAA